ncbi:MAG: NADH-quinone oxidoreductase subunit N [Deltaproteobacteria bacterium]|nr:NADH-quinone oxidoreductase subunit N [Deltaproteobacteria bacterium]
MVLTVTDWLALAPALCLIVAGIAAVGVDLWLRGRYALVPLAISMIGLGSAFGILLRLLLSGGGGYRAFDGTIVLDEMAATLSLGVCLATTLILSIAPVDALRRRTNFGELYGLILISAAAMVLLLCSNDFMLVFLNIEVMSIAMYVLTGITRRNPRSNEAALKYLVTGAFATGFLLFGVALLYGATGSFRLEGIGAALTTGNHSALLPLGFGMLIVGFGFKVGAVPFHMWVPDVYEGAPTTTTAFMAVTVKAAATGAMMRVLLIAGASRPELWAPTLWWIALATMIVGNLLAAQQKSVKRMLAYSSVAHTGYALVAIATMLGTDGSFSTEGASAVIFYLFSYTFTTLGAFLFLVYMGHEAPSRSGPEWQDAETLDDLAGLGFRHPWAAGAMALFLISLGGIPPTAGFFGKFYLFQAAVEQGHSLLVVIGVMTSLVSLYYYLRVVVAMYMRPTETTDEQPRAAVGAVLLLASVATILLGILPGILVDWATRSIVSLH